MPCIEIPCALAGGRLQLITFVERFGEKIIIFSGELGRILLLLLSTLKQMIILPFEIKNPVRQMLKTSGGAEGVGKATTGAVILSSMTILSENGKISADIWDFSNDGKSPKNPHVKVGMEHFVFKNIFMSEVADNILNKKWRGGYAGIGMRCEDEDFKYLFGTLLQIPTN
jgi:hypothetical protein